MDRTYLCIDLKSFFASVECVERGLSPDKDNLVVADASRGRGAISLAITPALKALGVKNRCRLFEIPPDIKYFIAKPRMSLYMKTSGEIYAVYLKFFCPEDIYVYSIDECFIDLTEYLSLYNLSPFEIAHKLKEEILLKMGLKTSIGIGTNLFLAKVALDISAKKSPNSVGFLNEELFKKEIWHHKPITDVWNIGDGIAKRLKEHGITDLYGITKCHQEILYKEFGINAELLIDHANGIEPCTLKDIKNYKSKTNSLSNSQVLFENYCYKDAFLVLKEMVYQISLSLIEKKLSTNLISLSVSYSNRLIKSTGGMKKLNKYTNSYKNLIKDFTSLFKKFADENLLIRKITISVDNIISDEYLCFDFFNDFEKISKEKNVNEAIIEIKNKFGKNAILKGLSYEDKATMRLRNNLIGGHNGGEDEDL